ncbi:hypothetical protein DI53_0463 [Sphingobacterium deserti]|uniref:Uncharacterized protein n=1 Tax=Sphingobacterium deserti TaxID=1229276 RepID=A0A0B8TBS5_9SPHI|nr:hypothetical protein DI53_0463 [Sphingobacterium deserti]
MPLSIDFINNYATGGELSKWQSFRNKNDYICTNKLHFTITYV